MFFSYNHGIDALQMGDANVALDSKVYLADPLLRTTNLSNKNLTLHQISLQCNIRVKNPYRFHR